ncbi:MAG: restriction endonuclease subunit S [Desulfovibrio sp.]
MKWPIARLESLASKEANALVGGPFGSKLTARDYVNTGIPVIRGSNLNNGRYLDLSNFVYVSEQKAKKDLASNLAFSGDIIFTQRGTLGQVSIIPENIEIKKFVVSQSQMKLTIDKSKVDKMYLYYFFSNKQTISKILNLTSSSGVPHINLTILKKFEVPLPQLSIQQRISSILSAYDDLIENNRRRIALLEQSARLLYQEWFVRFRFPGHEKVKIVDGVPEGWEEKTIRDISCYINRGIAPRYADDGNSIVINQKCIRNNMLNLEPSRRQTKPFKEDKQIRFGDVLINSTGTGTLGRIAQCWIDIDKCTIDSHVTIARPKQGIQKYWYGFSIIPLQEYFEAKGEGSTNQKELNRKTIEDTRILFPSHAPRELFENHVTPAVQQISILHMQNQKLAAARDLLLPRLMSGEIAV